MSLKLQSSVAYANLAEYHPAQKIFGPVEGNVIAIHWPHEVENRSKREIEYDIQPLTSGMGIIRNAPLALGLAGYATAGINIQLTPASTCIPLSNFNIDTHGVAADTDGDRVLVQFLNGSFQSPIITAVLTHRQIIETSNVPTQYKNGVEVLAPFKEGDPGYQFGAGGAGKTQADLTALKGARSLHWQIGGTHFAVDNNGDVFVNCKAHPDTNVKNRAAGDVQKKLVIQNEGQDLLRIEMKSGGNLEVFLGGNNTSIISIGKIGGTLAIIKDKVIALGKDSPGDAAAVASLVKQEIQKGIDWVNNTLIGLYAAHTHSSPVGPTGPPAAPLTPAPSACADVASKVVLLEKP